MSPDFSSDEYRDSQREAWTSVAAAWKAWWKIFEAGAQPVNEVLVERAATKFAGRALDVATGIGEPSITAAKTVGPEGSVLAVDLAPDMLKFAAERAAEHDVRNIEFLESDAEEMELEAESFDSATSRWGLMLMRDPAKAIERVRAALKPDARFAAAVWAPEDQAPFLSLTRSVLERELNLPPRDPNEPGPFRLCTEGALDALFVEGGFEDVARELVTVTTEFANADEYVECTAEMSSSFRKAIADLDPVKRDQVLEAVRAAANSHADERGHIRFESLTWVVSGRRP